MKERQNILAQRLRGAKAGSRGGLQNRKLCALLLSAMIVGILALYPAFSSLMNAVVITNTAEISLSVITAKSGSPSDIQAAINAVVSAGGGTVYVPAGTFTFNPPMNGTGVTIPFTTVPINIIGAGIGQTILQETTFSQFSTMFVRSGSQGYTGAAVRISGISFVGLVLTTNLHTGITDDWNTQGNVGISIECTQDFRIDHCSFQNFCSAAITTDDNTGGTSKLVDRGVIDHCSFDNPYRDACQPHNATGLYYAVGGYGVIVIGDYESWDTNIADYLGNYYQTATTNSSNCPTGIYGEVVPQPIYIENCNFSRCRHAISANGGGFYVARYDYFQQALYPQCDMHGNAGNGFGTRADEVYSCIFNLTDESYSDGQDGAGNDRGGGGVFWNNTVILNPSYNTATFELQNDGESYPYDVEQYYLWNNTAMWTNGTLVSFNSKITNSGGYVQNVNYFLFAPNGTNANGLTGPSSYTPYTYPLPLTLTGPM